MKMDDDLLKLYAVKDGDGLVRTLYYAGSNRSAWFTFKQLLLGSGETEVFSLWYMGHFEPLSLAVIADVVKEITEEPV